MGGGCGLYSWPPGLNEMKAYLARPDVKKALHVPIPSSTTKPGIIGATEWVECNSMVSTRLQLDRSDPPYNVGAGYD
jgi:hypothetical protein